MSRSLNLAALSSGAIPLADSGDPQATIIDQAVSKKADLIVMGTHGRRGFKRLLLGSVTEAVLREAPCPVLTVPPHVSATASEAGVQAHSLSGRFLAVGPPGAGIRTGSCPAS